MDKMQINLKIELLKMYYFLTFLFVPVLLTRIKCYKRANIHFNNSSFSYLAKTLCFQLVSKLRGPPLFIMTMVAVLFVIY